MRIQLAITAAALAAAFLAPAAARAQDTGIKKVGSELHHAAKKTGNAVKGGAAHVAAATHHELKKVGNGTKNVLHRSAEGGETVGSKTKHVVRKAAAKTHHALKKTGNKIKAEIKK